jgi:hypothetical protein
LILPIPATASTTTPTAAVLASAGPAAIASVLSASPGRNPRAGCETKLSVGDDFFTGFESLGDHALLALLPLHHHISDLGGPIRLHDENELSRLRRLNRDRWHDDGVRVGAKNQGDLNEETRP